MIIIIQHQKTVVMSPVKMGKQPEANINVLPLEGEQMDVTSFIEIKVYPIIILYI